MTPARMLVLAKAPVAGRVKTRLGADVGMDVAAEVAAAALLDTLRACTEAAGPAGCHLALAGPLEEAVRGPEIERALQGWTVRPQRGEGLAERIANAHLDLADGTGPVVQVGMDTPQLDAGLLCAVGRGTASYDAVLGPAEDGGWWVLGLADPAHGALLRDVPMSTPHTHDDTRAALRAGGLAVAAAPTLRDVDTLEDAEAVLPLAPRGHFAGAWEGVRALDGSAGA